MTSRTRAIVLSITAPVVAFAIVGGFLGRVMAREDTYQHLKIFDDVVSLISSNYVEPVNLDKVMRGAMNGLADSLDADSAYLTVDEVKQVEAATPLAPAEVGIEMTRQYYLRIISARENSPAAKAGLRTGDYVRAINDVPTRDMSVWEGVRALRGARRFESEAHGFPQQPGRPARRGVDAGSHAARRRHRTHGGRRHRLRTGAVDRSPHR